MQQSPDHIPRILCIGGHDPTGGAGTQADIETVQALGGRALTLVTALTVQDSIDIRAILPTPGAFFANQFDVLLADITPQAIKIGMLASTELIGIVRQRLAGFDGPIVLDPVLAAGGGFDLDRQALSRQIREQLIPLASLMTPNRAEARRLADCDDADAAACRLVDAGAAAVLLTGADEAEGERVRNRLFRNAQPPQDFDWPRLPQVYHGSGCTLASACATRLAFGDELPVAVTSAQAFAWQALDRAVPVGRGQWLPVRQA